MELLAAVQNGDLAEVRKLVANGEDPNFRDDRGNSALHYAAGSTYNCTDVIEFLVEKNGEVNAHNEDGITPLHQASFCGLPETIKCFVRLGADLESKDVEESTPLHQAASCNALPCLRTLLELGANINNVDMEGLTALHHATLKNCLEAVQELLDHGADINIAETEEGSTPLHLAAFSGFLEGLPFLVKRGADLSKTDKDGATALHKATFQGHDRCMEYLLDQGSDIDARDKTGSTPLHFAAYQGHRSCLDLLIERNADLDPVNTRGSTPLVYASKRGHVACVERLRECGAKDVEARDIDGSAVSPSLETENDKISEDEPDDGEGSSPLEESSEDLVVDSHGFLVSSTLGDGGTLKTTPTKKKAAKEAKTSDRRTLRWHKMMVNWEKKEKRPDKLPTKVMQGVPPPVRGTAWKLACNAHKKLKQNEGQYEHYKKAAEGTPDANQIDKDIKRTHRNHVLFKDADGVGQVALANILKAYSVHNPKVGYCQGMATITSQLLMYMEEEEAFWVLCACVDSIDELYQPGLPLLLECFYIFENLTKECLPKLFRHMEKENMMTSMYATQWFISWFVGCIDYEIVLRFWDLILVLGYDTVFYCALSVMKYFEDELLSKPFEDMMQFLAITNLSTQKIDSDEILRIFKKWSEKVKKKRIQLLRSRYRNTQGAVSMSPKSPKEGKRERKRSGTHGKKDKKDKAKKEKMASSSKLGKSGKKK